MRTVLLAWTAGIWLLQQVAELPTESEVWALAGLTGLALGGAALVEVVWRRYAAVGLPLTAGLEGTTGWAGKRWAFSFSWRWCRPMAWACLAACLGYDWAAWRAHVRLADALDPAWEQREVVVTGIIASLPTHHPGSTHFQFDVEQVTPSHARIPKRIQLSWNLAPRRSAKSRERSESSMHSHVNPEGRHEPPSRAAPSGMPSAGERWRFTVRLKRPHGFANWHGFDTEYWLLTQGVRATGQVLNASSVRAQRLEGRGEGWGYALSAWRERLRTQMKAAMPADGRFGGVLLALALGDRADIPASDWEMFQRTGVTHLLAISGLHVTLVAGVVAVIGGACWRRSCGMRGAWPLRVPTPRVAAIAGVAGALAYGALSGFGIPARRAVCMVVIFALTFGAGRSVGVSYVLAWALALIVATDPWAVGTAGLWLSFGAVGVLIYAGRDPRANVGESLEVMSRWGSRLKRHLASAARAQWAVTVGMVPLTLAWFGQVPLLGPLANAIAIPVMALVVTPLALGGLVLPSPLADGMLWVAHTLVDWLALWLGWLSAWPHAVWRSAIPSMWATMLALAGVVVCLTPRVMPSRGLGRYDRRDPEEDKTNARWRRARWAGVLLLIPALVASGPSLGDGEFRVTMLDIGQGNAVLVETAHHRLLYDAGPPLGERSDTGERVIVPYLRAQGVTRLDRFVISHAHADHYGGALSVIGAYPEVPMASSLPAKHPVRRKVMSHRACLAGWRWTWDGVEFAFLHPDAATLASSQVGANGQSCVLRISNRRHTALLAGDIESPQEAALLRQFARGDAGGLNSSNSVSQPFSERESRARAPTMTPRAASNASSLLRADILLAPHHGSLTSSTPAFVQAVAPRFVVFQAGFHNRFAHPRPAVEARYRAVGAVAFTSATDGAVRFETRGDKLEATAYRIAARRYWMIR